MKRETEIAIQRTLDGLIQITYWRPHEAPNRIILSADEARRLHELLGETLAALEED